MNRASSETIETRIFFAADLHGSELVLGKLINAAQFYKVKHIVVGGDLTGKVLVPIVSDGKGYRLELFGEQKRIRESELQETDREIRNNGYYYRVMGAEDYEAMGGSEEKVRKAFVEEVLASLGQFLGRAEAKLKPIGATIYLMPGNDDYDEVADYLKKAQGGAVVDFDKRIVDIDGYQFLGYGYSNETPWHTPRELGEDIIYKELKALAGKCDPARSVFVIHTPPSDTKIDRAPRLTKDLKQKVSAGYMESMPVGSSSVRKIIEEYSPIASLHGHVHESAGIDYIKSSKGAMVPVLNCGSDYGSGMLNGIILDFEGSRLKRYNFTRG